MAHTLSVQEAITALQKLPADAKLEIAPFVKTMLPGRNGAKAVHKFTLDYVKNSDGVRKVVTIE